MSVCRVVVVSLKNSHCQSEEQSLLVPCLTLDVPGVGVGVRMLQQLPDDGMVSLVRRGHQRGPALLRSLVHLDMRVELFLKQKSCKSLHPNLDVRVLHQRRHHLNDNNNYNSILQRHLFMNYILKIIQYPTLV